MRASIRLQALLLLIFVLFASACLRAQDRSAQPQFARMRAQHLRHGINTSGWFAQNPGHYSAQYTNAETTPADIALMAQLGFDNVRLGIDPDPLQQYPHDANGFNADFLSRLDRAVDEMLSHGMAVQIAIFPQDDYKQRLRNDPYAVDRFIMLWRKLAAHYATRNPDRPWLRAISIVFRAAARGFAAPMLPITRVPLRWHAGSTALIRSTSSGS